MSATVSWVRSISFRARLSMLVAAAVGITLALGALASYLAVHHQLYTQVDSSLRNEMAAAPRLSEGFNAQKVAGFLAKFNNSILQIIEPGGVAYTSRPQGLAVPVSQSDGALAVAPVSTQSLRTVVSHGVRYRVLTQGGGIVDQNFNPVAIQIARPLTDIDHSLAELRLILTIVAVGGIGFAVGLGYLVGRATMRPVVRLTAAAEHVAATHELSSTIDDEGDDELARLARSFNSMLAALEVSQRQQAQLISDAGHELRTPLTSLRTNIEVLMRVPDLPEADRAELMSDVNAQLEEMTTLIGDVVELAREDEQHAEPIEIRLDSIVDRAVERARRRAPLVQFDTQLTPGSVRGHPALLERAVLNLLDNAAKWSSAGGRVEVTLHRSDRWKLDVRDHGPGIAPGDLPHVFDRFYRAESARSMPGSGLGLAIVRQVVSAHGGNVSAASPPDGGTVIHVELPIVAEHEPEAGSHESAVVRVPE